MTYRSRILSKAFTAAISGVCAIMLPMSTALAVASASPNMQCVIKETPTTSLTEGQENVVAYTITVKNIGDAGATGVVIGDNISGTVNAAITSAPGCTNGGTSASCDIGNVAAGAEVVQAIEVTAASPVGGQSLTNIANVTSASDSNTNNNGGAGTACEVVLNVPVTPNPQLVCLNKTAVPTNVLAGEAVQYTINLQAGGNAVSENVTLTDVLPAGLNYVGSSAVPVGTCSEAGGTVTCDYGNLNPSDARTAVIDVAVANDAAPQSILNTATVAATNVTADNDDQCSAAITIEPPEEGLACRVTGGGIDKFGEWDGSWGKGHSKKDEDSKIDYYTFGGQAGANTAMQPDPKGEWTHHQQRGPNGSFIFHAGTASAPEATEITEIECSDPGYCDPARPAPAKQIDFNGVGSFKNMKNSPLDSVVDVGTSLHHFSVHIEDLGEPGRSGKQPPVGEQCPVGGSYGLLADCDCPDFYRLTVHATTDPASDVIYEVFGYIDGGNLQIHPPTGFDQNAGN